MFRVRALCVLVVVASLAGCSSPSKSATSHTSNAPPPLPSESPACAAGSLQLIGSTAFAPIAQAAANAYMQQCTSAKITITGGDSDYGLTQVRNAVAARSPSAGSMIAMYDGLSSDTAGLNPYPMGVLIFSVVAHAGLFPARNITAGELRRIFAKPGEQGIVAVGRRAGSGSRKAFVANVLGGKGVPPDKGNCPVPTGNRVSFTSCTEDSTTDVLKFVNSTPNAVGYAWCLRRSTVIQTSMLSASTMSHPGPITYATGRTGSGRWRIYMRLRSQPPWPGNFLSSCRIIRTRICRLTSSLAPTRRRHWELAANLWC